MTTESFEQLTAMSAHQLRSEWRRVHKNAPPVAFTADLLIRGLAYKLQEQRFGKLPIEYRRELDQLGGIVATPKPKGKRNGPLRPGSRLVRRWRGTTYCVDVLADEYEYRDKRYKSLSEIAREITGARWSGPRFFGCRS